MPINASGVATLANVTSLPAGSDTVYAVFNGDATFIASQGTVVQKVSVAATTTTVATSPVVFGNQATLTATVTDVTAASTNPAAPPGGTVTFYDGSTARPALGSAPPRWRLGGLTLRV